MLTGKLHEALQGPMVPKFLATANKDGVPNVVPLVSFTDIDEKTLAFAELMTWKTRKNLEENPRICVGVFTEDLHIWIIKARLREYVETGPILEQLNQGELYRYNAYMGASRGGVCDALEITGVHRLKKLGVLREFLAAKLTHPLSALTAGRRGKMPVQVMEKFNRLEAVKFLAFVEEDGYPTMVPALSMQPSSPEKLVFNFGPFGRELSRLAPGSQVAATVLTTDPISYQIKGSFEGARGVLFGKIGRISVREVYSACPPVPGRRLDKPD